MSLSQLSKASLRAAWLCNITLEPFEGTQWFLTHLIKQLAA